MLDTQGSSQQSSQTQILSHKISGILNQIVKSKSLSIKALDFILIVVT